MKVWSSEKVSQWLEVRGELFIHMFRTTTGTTSPKRRYYRPSDLTVGKDPIVIKEVRKIGLPILPGLSRYYQPGLVLPAKRPVLPTSQFCAPRACTNLACRYYRCFVSTTGLSPVPPAVYFLATSRR